MVAAGAGKTVLTASVIETIRKTPQDGESIAFFYCDFRDEHTTRAAAVICSILSQLLRKLRNSTGRDLPKLVDDMVSGKTEGSLVLEHAGSMAPFVSRAARQFSRQPFVVLDALDECQDVESLLRALHELRKGGMRLLVTSRPLPIIRDRFYGLPFISMDRMAKEVSADIKLHVTREIDGVRRLRLLEEKLKREVLITLQTKADGMFRWIQCQIDTLRKCATGRDIRTALYSLPRGLDETYERILGAIDPHSSDGKALSIDLQGRRLDREIAPVHGYALLDTLGSLVAYNDETDVVDLAHFSIKEYLIGTSCLMSLPMCHIDMQEAHVQVALLCMCYVTSLIKYWPLMDTETALQIPSDQKTDNESLPLRHYTFRHGFRHLACLESPNGAVMDGMIALRLDIERYPVQWRLIMMWELATSDLPPPGCPSSELHSQHDFIIYILISSLPESFLRAFLRRAPFKVFGGTSPLIYATYFGKFEHARTLLSCGVSHVNGTGLDVRSPR
ncbi:hypothetical protein HD554DRAFT_791948 [Boletus coccyginus]|nr:hypothetical protein HD554DRAFT_791948 [Boletus coccyginus]